MKRSILLFSMAAGLFYLTLTSYSSGPAANGEGNRTTSGSNATCAGGCHGANNANTIINITLKDGVTPVTNGKYKPNTLYTVTLAASNPTTPAKYGFQLTAVKAAGAQGGTLTASGSLHTITAGTGGLTVVEQKSPITATGGAATMPSFSWLSPAAGIGTIAFHVTMNAVNGNGSADNNDHASTANFTFTEGTLSVNDLKADIRIIAYPNPVSDKLHLQFEGADQGSYNITVIDMKGSRVMARVGFVDGANTSLSIDMNELAPGLYLVQVAKDGRSRTIPVSRQ